MTDVSRQQRITRTRKPHVCEQCEKPIEVGSSAVYFCGRWEGEWYQQHQHEDCHEAAAEYAHKNDLYGEDWPWWHAEEWDAATARWMKAEYPAVFARLGWDDPDAEDSP